MTKHESRGRGLVVLALKLLVSAGLFAAVIALNRHSFAEALAHRPDVGALLFALGCYLSGVMLAFCRWHMLVRALDLPFTRREAFRLGWIGMFFNLVIPGAVGGDVVKGAYIARQQHHKAKAIASVIIDRLVGLIGLFVLAVVGGLAAWNSLDPRVRPITIAACIALSASVLLTLASFWIRPHGPIRRLTQSRPRLANLFGELHAMGVAYRRRLAWVGAAVLLATITHVLNVFAFAAVGRAIATGSALPSLLGYFTVVPLVLFSTAIPLPFSGLGAAESVSSLLFNALDYRGGAIAMIGFRMFQLVAAVIGWMFYLGYKRSPVDREQPPAPHARALYESDTSEVASTSNK